MTSKQLREEFKRYWSSAPRNFKEVPNMSLVPNVDSTLLFVNSGMFPLAPYLSGEPHPLGTRLFDIQRCLRTNYDEMIEIGDNRHTLMFEMIGDWSLGDFTKKEQIPWIMQFWVEVCKMDPKRLYVSVFAGDDDAPRDTQAIELWVEAFKKYGVNAKFSEDIHNIPNNLEDGNTWEYRIFPYPKKKNWWERAHSVGELGGPTSEMFYDMGFKEKDDESYHINDDSGRFIEIGNNVFMEYKLDENMKWVPLKQKNIDFGGGFERIAMIVQGKNDIYETDIYMPIIKKIEELSGKDYKTDGVDNGYTKYFRILADHSRAATFILADGVYPSNKDQGYILRRFIRRLVRFGLKLDITSNFTKDLALEVINILSYEYTHLRSNENMIIDEIEKEEIKFRRTLDKGLRFLQKYIQDLDLRHEEIKFSGKQAFDLYETYGFPVEMTLDELNLSEEDSEKLMNEFKEEEKKHRDQSRLGAEAKFKGGLADSSVETTKLHTAHHLLLASLQQIVSKDIKQRGSNITSERLRIDFNLNRKLTDEEIKSIEDLVNEKISQGGLDVVPVSMIKDKAEQLKAQMEFGQKYPDTVFIYLIGKDIAQELISQSEIHANSFPTGGDPDEAVTIIVHGKKVWLPDSLIVELIKNNKLDIFSMEFCGGPHVKNTSELGEGGKRFKILSQENIGSGLKRIKASLV